MDAGFSLESARNYRKVTGETEKQSSAHICIQWPHFRTIRKRKKLFQRRVGMSVRLCHTVSHLFFFFLSLFLCHFDVVFVSVSFCPFVSLHFLLLSLERAFIFLRRKTKSWAWWSHLGQSWTCWCCNTKLVRS